MELRPGIYKIINLKNQKVYIGESLYLNRRWGEHLEDLISNNHYNILLQEDFNKYGIVNFQYEVIEEFPITDSNMKLTSIVKIKTVLVCREKSYIEQYKKILGCYNSEDSVNEIIAGRKHLISDGYNLNSSSILSNYIKRNPNILNADYKISESDFVVKIRDPTYKENQILNSRTPYQKKQNQFSFDCVHKLINLKYNNKYKSRVALFAVLVSTNFVCKNGKEYYPTEFAISNKYILKRKLNLIVFTLCGYNYLINYLNEEMI